MATSRGSCRSATRGFAVLTTLATLCACNALALFQTGAVNKLYIKAYTLDVSARLISGVSSPQFEQEKITNVRSLGNIGLVYSPNYIFVADPELLVQTTVPVDIPSEEAVQEPAGFDADGAPITETVLRNPLYIINKTTLTYSVPGYTIPDVTVTQDIPIKSNSYTMHLGGVAQVNELMAAFSQDPAKIGSVAGSVTISLDISDQDPLAFTKEFTVARSFPLVYSYLPFTPETDISPPPSPFIIPTFAPTLPASTAATAAPTPTTAPTSAPLSF